MITIDSDCVQGHLHAAYTHSPMQACSCIPRCNSNNDKFWSKPYESITINSGNRSYHVFVNVNEWVYVSGESHICRFHRCMHASTSMHGGRQAGQQTRTSLEITMNNDAVTRRRVPLNAIHRAVFEWQVNLIRKQNLNYSSKERKVVFVASMYQFLKKFGHQFR
jgi:hypothetical protein